MQVSWLPAIHFDVIKTRMMAENDPKRFRSVWHCFNVVVKVNKSTIQEFILLMKFRSRNLVSNHCFEVERF